MDNQKIEELSKNLTEIFITTRRLKLNSSDDNTISAVSGNSYDDSHTESDSTSSPEIAQFSMLSNDQVDLTFSAIVAEMNRRGLTFPFAQDLALKNAQLNGSSPATVTTSKLS